MPTSTTTAARRPPARRRRTLTVAVTGAGGTIGPALLERLIGSPRIGRVVLLGRHRTPGTEGGPKLEFRHVDVRDSDAVEVGVAGADVVVHMAFALYGIGIGEHELFATNVQGTRNVARAAVSAGSRRFLYTSSAAVYGGRPGSAEPLAESEPLRASARLFYARHKAQAELVVRRELAGSATALYLFRPCAIVGPHAAGAVAHRLPGRLGAALRSASRLSAAAGLRPALPPPPVPLQFVHEDDVAEALQRAVEGRGRPGTYNLAGDGTVSGTETLHRLGLRALPVPPALTGASVRALRLLPPVVPALAWPELVSAPLLLDTGQARRALGWRPRFSSAGALDATREALGW
ncbi:MAG: NAD-dependent epimerase/dehydratase family protein [Solirubrobacterales bacterium]|nr:NAD-dependent epimerase/dehydratase family protein [Solirubrobacterales bacterium]MBV9715317.1 NAD-dependent epimerase/dehydratase family protein [Solirubrobacterales bacterium]